MLPMTQVSVHLPIGPPLECHRSPYQCHPAHPPCAAQTPPLPLQQRGKGMLAGVPVEDSIFICSNAAPPLPVTHK
jgi:hypothetical protein